MKLCFPIIITFAADAANCFALPSVQPAHARPLLHPSSSDPRAAVPVIAADTAIEKPFWEPWRVHDAANLAVLPLLIGLTTAGLINTRWNYPLALAMLIYIVLDGLWIAAVPSAVGSPGSLLGHHLVTALLLLHPLTWAPHLGFTSFMTVVEYNTFFLILKRWRSHVLINALFTLTWVVTRVLWFPAFAVYCCFFSSGWGALSTVRRVLVCSCVSSLALLQLQWTANALRPKPATPDQEKEGFL